MESKKEKTFFRRYKRYIVISIAVYVVLTLLLIVLAMGPQKGAFIYQIF